MFDNFRDLGWNMNIKVHYSLSHLERFPENLGDNCEESHMNDFIKT